MIIILYEEPDILQEVFADHTIKMRAGLLPSVLLWPRIGPLCLSCPSPQKLKILKQFQVNFVSPNFLHMGRGWTRTDPLLDCYPEMALLFPPALSFHCYLTLFGWEAMLVQSVPLFRGCLFQFNIQITWYTILCYSSTSFDIRVKIQLVHR